jgi:hypothetical protein
MPNYLGKVHGFNTQQIGGASFIIFLSEFVGELVGGFLCDMWKSAGGSPNKVMRAMLAFASVVVTVAVFSVAYASGPVLTVVLLSVTLFFHRWTGLYWSIPSLVGTRDKVGLIGGADEPRWQYRRSTRTAGGRHDRAANRLVLPRTDGLYRCRYRSAGLLDVHQLRGEDSCLRCLRMTAMLDLYVKPKHRATRTDARCGEPGHYRAISS